MQVDEGKQWILNEVLKLSPVATPEQFRWETLRTDTHEGVVLVTHTGDHLFFPRERLEDCAHGEITQAQVCAKLRDRIRLAQRKRISKAESVKYSL